jgi:hypothetical protein
MTVGVVMTSTVTNLSLANQPTSNLYASRITLPALVVWHQDDHCSLSPPAGSAVLFALIPSAGKASRKFVHGHSVATEPCGALFRARLCRHRRKVGQDDCRIHPGEIWIDWTQGVTWSGHLSVVPWLITAVRRGPV